jgi:hypothetical protein
MGKPKPSPFTLQKGISSRAKKNQNNEHMDRTISQVERKLTTLPPSLNTNII